MGGEQCMCVCMPKKLDDERGAACLGVTVFPIRF